MKLLFLSIEINLILWLAVFGMIQVNPSEIGLAKTTAIAGCVFAAVLQHGAYYKLRKNQI